MRNIFVHCLLFISFIASLAAQDKEPEIFRKSPHLVYTGKTNEMKITWQINKDVLCQLAWGTDVTYSIDTVITKAHDDSVHTFLFTNLSPGEKTYYCVKAENQKFAVRFIAHLKQIPKT